MLFSAIHGYTLLKQRLMHIARTNQVPHAQLFWGPEGNASLPLALAFITYLNCQNRQKDDACGQCAACIKMQKLVHPDVRFVFPICSAKQNKSDDTVSIDFMHYWRNFVHEYPYGNANDWSHYLHSANKPISIVKEEAKGVIQTISLKSFEGKYKVVCIWLPEYLHAAAANALLKIIEDPPTNSLFLLVGVTLHNILDTIRSRTQQIYVPAFTDQSIASMLTKKHTLAPDQLAQVILLANGNVNVAYKLAANRTESYFEYFKNWMRSCYQHDWTKLVAQATSFQEMGKAIQKDFLSYSLHMLRAAMLLSLTAARCIRVTDTEIKFIQKLRQFLTHQQIQTWITWCNQTYHTIERNTNPKMAYMNLSSQIAFTFRH